MFLRRAPRPARKTKGQEEVANYINTNWPQHVAEVVAGHCNTDRKIGRLRHPGKGRHGSRLIVRERPTGRVVLDHNAAETYRCNEEVEEWVRKMELG